MFNQGIEPTVYDGTYTAHHFKTYFGLSIFELRFVRFLRILWFSFSINFRAPWDPSSFKLRSTSLFSCRSSSVVLVIRDRRPLKADNRGLCGWDEWGLREVLSGLGIGSSILISENAISGSVYCEETRIFALLSRKSEKCPIFFCVNSYHRRWSPGKFISLLFNTVNWRKKWRYSRIRFPCHGYRQLWHQIKVLMII